MSSELQDDGALPICPECSATFVTARGLASHMKKHAVVEPCPYCGKSVRYLGRHIHREHEEKDPLKQVVEEVAGMARRIRDLEAENARLRQAGDPLT